MVLFFLVLVIKVQLDWGYIFKGNLDFNATLCWRVISLQFNLGLFTNIHLPMGLSIMLLLMKTI
jgi:hypothetical protein